MLLLPRKISGGAYVLQRLKKKRSSTYDGFLILMLQLQPYTFA